MASERWFTGARVTVHVENDGARFLTKGSESADREMTLAEAVSKYGREFVERNLKMLLDSCEPGPF